MTHGRRAAVLALLRRVSRSEPVVVAEQELGGWWAPVTRLVFERDLPDVGPSVIVKTRRDGVVGWGDAEHFAGEQAALTLLGSSGLGPRLIAADDDKGVMLLGDLGELPTVESILLGRDRDRAIDALCGLATTVGRLHAETVGRDEEHSALRDSLGGRLARPDRLGLWPGPDEWDAVEHATRDLGFPDAGAARDDANWLVERLAEPAPFLALSHPDPQPQNALVASDHVALVDFEGCAFRHTGTDAAFFQFPFPNYSAHWHTIPEDVKVLADGHYRRELAAAVAAASDDETYAQVLAEGCGVALAVRVQRLPKLAQTDQSSAESWRRRAQLVQQIGVFIGVARRAGWLSDLADWFEDLAVAMAGRWPDATHPAPTPFPAFCDSAD